VHYSGRRETPMSKPNTQKMNAYVKRGLESLHKSHKLTLLKSELESIETMLPKITCCDEEEGNFFWRSRGERGKCLYRLWHYNISSNQENWEPTSPPQNKEWTGVHRDNAAQNNLLWWGGGKFFLKKQGREREMFV